MALLGCESPKAPTFFTRLTIPFSKDMFDIYDLRDEIEGSKDSIRLVILNDSVLIDISRAVDPVKVEDNLSADPTSDSTEGSVNNDLTFREEISEDMSLGTLAPPAIRNLHGQTVPIPPFSFADASVAIDFDSLVSAGAVSGIIVATLTNGIPITFDTLFYELVDPSQPGTPIASFLFLNLAHNITMSRSDTIDYNPENPVNVTSPIEVRISGHSTGSNGVPVTVDTSDAIHMILGFDLICRNITGRIQPQVLVRTDSVKSTSNSLIDSARISQGQITFQVRNNDFPVGATIDYVSPDFIAGNGASLSGTIAIPSVPGDTTPRYTIVLDGYTLRPSRPATIGNQYFYFSYVLSSEGSSVPITIQNNQGVVVTSTIDTMKFDWISGTLAEETIDISPRSEAISIEDIDSITLTAAYLEIIAEHNIQFPIALDLDILGKKSSTQQQRTVHVVGDFQRYTGPLGGSRRDTIRTGSAQSDEIAQLFNILPDSITASGSAVIGDALQSGTVTRNDSIKVTLSIRAPMVFSLANDSTRNIIRPKPRKMDLSDRVQELLADNVESVNMTGHIENHFPVGVEVQFFIDTVARSDSAFYDSAVFVYPQIPLRISKATTHPVSGLVTAPTIKELDLPLDQSEYEWLFNTRAEKYRGLRIRLLGTGGTVKVSSRDHVKINTDFEVELKVDENLP